jgi:hypothetical protein
MNIFDSFKEAKKIYGSDIVDMLLEKGIKLKNILIACERYVNNKETIENIKKYEQKI